MSLAKANKMGKLDKSDQVLAATRSVSGQATMYLRSVQSPWCFMQRHLRILPILVNHPTSSREVDYVSCKCTIAWLSTERSEKRRQQCSSQHRRLSSFCSALPEYLTRWAMPWQVEWSAITVTLSSLTFLKYFTETIPSTQRRHAINVKVSVPL